MTYRELLGYAQKKIDNNEITVGEYVKMTKPLNREVDVLDKIRAEIEQINEFDYPKDDRTMSKFKGIVLDIIRKHTGIPSDEEMKYRMENCCCIGEKVRE